MGDDSESPDEKDILFATIKFYNEESKVHVVPVSDIKKFAHEKEYRNHIL